MSDDYVSLDGVTSLRCPRCKRETYYVQPIQRVGCSGKKIAPPKPGMIQAIRRDGLCTTCKRVLTGERQPKELTSSGFINRKHNRMTEEELQAIRDSIQCMEIDRLARGIPVDGIPVEQWAFGNGGAYASEIP